MNVIPVQAQELARAAAQAEHGVMPRQSSVRPQADSVEARPLPEFLNRDLSWLEFNRRVLHEALDERTPLLERLRFLGIFTRNLDEFYMKRIGALKRQVQEGTVTQTPEGL